MKFQIITSVINGKFKRNLNTIIEAVKAFEGKECLITIEKLGKKRSNNQNRYYWGVVLPIIQQGLKEATGEFRSSENIHYNILLPLFAPEKEIVNINTGECIYEKLTSSEMTTTQFCEYIIEIQKWASEFLGVYIPEPNEEMMLDL